MPLALAVAGFVVGIAGIVVASGEFLRAAEKIGERLKLPKFVMGVLLIALGTSLPELATAVTSGIEGIDDIVIGNVLGANTVGVLVVLSLAVLLHGPLRMTAGVFAIDMPMVLATAILFALLAADGEISRFDAALLLLSALMYLVYTVFYRDDDTQQVGIVAFLGQVLRPGGASRSGAALRDGSAPRGIATGEAPLVPAAHPAGGEPASGAEPERRRPPTPIWRTWLIFVVSIVLLAALARLMVDSLLVVVAELGLETQVFSFFALAIGTTLPEFFIVLRALRRDQGDLVLGNVVGSIMFNSLLVPGIAAVVVPQRLVMPEGMWMLLGSVIAALLLVVASISRRIHIWEGGAFALVYVAVSLQVLGV